MIVQTTFFKEAEHDSSQFDEVRSNLVRAVQEKLVSKGRMAFYHRDLKYIGPDLNGEQWDRVIVYELKDFEAFHEWSSLPEHAAIDHAYTKAGVIKKAFGYQFTDDPDPALRKKLADYFAELGKNRERFPRGLNRT